MTDPPKDKMGRSTTLESVGHSSSSMSSTPSKPFHFNLHKPGYHIESCCGICNLFPGVLLIAFAQILVGSILLTLILTNGLAYDELHRTSDTQLMSTASGITLCGVTGAGLLLMIVALTENCRAMLVYLMVATMLWVNMLALATTKIMRSCFKFKEAVKVKDDDHRMTNLACASGLYTFFGSVLYFITLIVVFSFYHFRYVRRAILMHEAVCVSS